MQISLRFAALGLAMLVASSLSTTPPAQARTQRNLARSAQLFVQRFYDEVVTASNRNGSAAEHSSDFPLDPELERLLKLDEEESDAFPGEIAGLDFDPFAAGNDVAAKYDVGRVERRGDRYYVDVYHNWTGKKREARPSHAIELSRRGGRWTIMNVHYYSEPNDPPARTFDLISTLHACRKERQERQAQPH